MRHGSLFSWIGGFDLAAEWMGWENVFHCEINKFCQKILKQYWPDAEMFVDIKQSNFKSYANQIDIISGGFPCQPYSVAGERKGKEDDRHLWPEMLRAIREIQPRWVVGENVHGLLNWNRGMVLDEIKADLETAGFEILPPLVLPACGVNAPHRRDRVWIIAHAVNGGYKAGRETETEKNGVQGIGRQAMDAREFNGAGISSINTNGHHKRLQGGKINGGVREVGQERNKQLTGHIPPTWEKFPTQSPICGGNDGISFELDFIERIKNEKEHNKETDAEINFIRWEVLRNMWECREFAKTSHELYCERFYDSMSIVPQERTHEGWNMGQRIEESEELHDMWGSFYSKPYEETQDLQQRMFEQIRQIERREKMAQRQRTDRIKALGNAIVPQVAYEIFKAIELVQLNGASQQAMPKEQNDDKIKGEGKIDIK